MKKAAFYLSILFTALTFAAIFYLLSHGGKPNAGYAVIPMVFALLSLLYYQKK